jgi:hypothetical protein
MQADSLLTQGSVSPTAALHLGPSAPEGGNGRASQGSAGRAGAMRPNRRNSPRYSAVTERLWVGWWADGEFMLVEAHLVNISDGGVLVGINPSPAQGQRVWLRLTGSTVQESLEAVVLESRWGMLKRRFSARLGFREACPPEFYETAIYGQSPASSRLGVS